jgi:hypothetical protein
MDKQGALYFKLLTGVFLLILAGYAIPGLWDRGPAYELHSTQICEVGDGITVSGFVVRSEKVLFTHELPGNLPQEGQRVNRGQGISPDFVIPESGYFSHNADGYESILTPEFLLSCKAEDLYTLQPRPLPHNAVGRLIRGQTWYFAASGDFPELKSGTTVSLSIEDKPYKAEVLRTQGILLLQCDSCLHELTNVRRTEAELSLDSFPAIPLPREAVFYENGESCVYVLRGAQARRTPVRILAVKEKDVWIHPEDLPQGSPVILTDIKLEDGMVLK